MIIRQDHIVSFFVILSFLASIPTWYIDQYTEDDLAWFIYDFCNMVRISLLPLLVYFIAQNNVVKIGALLYFGLTTFNLIDIVLMYYFEPETWTMILKISLAGLIVIYLMYRMWKDEGAFRDE